MLCAISYHLHNLENVKNTHGGVLLLVKLQAEACKKMKKKKKKTRNLRERSVLV